MDGVQIGEAAVVEFLGAKQEFAESIGATFFELTTALAFHHFATCNVDVAVVETGLGGRLDSTNVLVPMAAVVTNIGMDHTDLLGDTLEEIALEKAGIFKRGVPAIVGEPKQGISGVLEGSARAAGSVPILSLDQELKIDNVKVTTHGMTFDLHGSWGVQSVRTPLLGTHQARNTALAILALQASAQDWLVPRAQWSSALASIHLPARFQRFEKYIFDVAHNPAGAAALAATITKISPPHPRTALVAMLGDKDWRGFLGALAPVVDRLFITTPPDAPAGREFDAGAAYEYSVAQGWNAELDLNFDDAVTRVSKRCGTVVITGSFHTVGAAMSRLQRVPITA